MVQDNAVSHPDVENSALGGRVALARFPALLPMSPTAKTLDKLGEKATERRAANSTKQVVRSMLSGVVLPGTHARLAWATSNEQYEGFLHVFVRVFYVRVSCGMTA